MTPQTYPIVLSVNGDNVWSATVTSRDEDRLLLAVGNGILPLNVLVDVADRVLYHQQCLAAEQRGLLAQGIVHAMPRPIRHTADCQRRAELARAWHTLWPHHCKLCHGEGGKYYPGTREEPPDYDVCLCLNMGMCSRCMLPAQSYSIARVLAYELYNLAHTLDRHIKQQLGVAHSPSARSDPEWSRRYKVYADLWYRTTYDQLTSVAQFFVDLAEKTDPIDDEQDWDGTRPIKPCMHCGFHYGRRINDLPADVECYCEMES